MRFGVDVSSNNPHPMNWPAIAAYLKQLGGGAQPFAIIKITQGDGYVNSDEAVDIVQSRAQGMALAGYLMDQGNKNVAAEEALYQRTTSLPQADDIELPEGLSVAAYIVHSHDLINIHPAALSYLNQSEVHEGFPGGAGLWLAEYNNNPGSVITPCTIHQYTSSGTIPNAAGEFDMNAWTGSDEQWNAFFGGVQPAPAPAPVPAPAPPANQNAILELIAAAKKTTLKQGSKGLFVGMLQRRLSQLNYNRPGLVDSNINTAVFGPATTSAVKALQSMHHLGVDGVVGKNTWSIVFP